MIFELSLESTLKNLNIVDECPDGFVDLSAVIQHINNLKAVVAISRPDTRSGLLRLTTTIFDELRQSRTSCSDHATSLDYLCKEFTLALLIGELLSDNKPGLNFTSPQDVMNQVFGKAYMARLELELKSVPYWVIKSSTNGEDRAVIDVSGCATLARPVATVPKAGDDDNCEERIFFDGGWFTFIPKSRIEPDHCEPVGPEYAYDDKSWRSWWENLELPEVDDEDTTNCDEEDEGDL